MFNSQTILAIETSCDDTSVAILKGRKVLANVTYTQAIHEQYGGVVPELASREHDLKIALCVEAAFRKVGWEGKDAAMHQIDGIAVTQGPGLMGSLLVGLTFAKALALSWNKPLIGINHMDAHIYANFIDHDINFPFLAIVVSGGHTQLVKVTAPFEHQILGKTRDDAAGEAFDKSGKILGLDYPAGPQMDKLAQNGNPSFLPLPIGLKNEGLDFSYSGLKTAILYAYNTMVEEHGPEYIKEHLNDLCASISDAITEALIVKTKRALKTHPDVKQIVLAGGVSANSMLRKKIEKLTSSKNLLLAFPKMEYCTDNAAMIGITAQLMTSSATSTALDNSMLEMQAYARA